MNYSFYVTDHLGCRVPVNIRPAEKCDYHATVTDHWQTKWTSSFIQNHDYEKFAMEVTETKELIGLLACKILVKDQCLRLVYMEAAPQSNPTLVKKKDKKYNGVGKVFIAYGVSYAVSLGMDGTLSFKAKTSELANWYQNQYGARRLLYDDFEMIMFPEAGYPILKDYIEEVPRDD